MSTLPSFGSIPAFVSRILCFFNKRTICLRVDEVLSQPSSMNVMLPKVLCSCTRCFFQLLVNPQTSAFNPFRCFAEYTTLRFLPYYGPCNYQHQSRPCCSQCILSFSSRTNFHLELYRPCLCQCLPELSAFCFSYASHIFSLFEFYSVFRSEQSF